MITDSTASLIAYWSEGDVKDYTAWYYRYSYQNNKLASVDSNQYHVRISVLEELPTNYTLSWQIQIDEEYLSDPFAEIINGLVIKYKTDELGAFSEVINIEEIMEVLKRSFDEAEKQLSELPEEGQLALENIENSISNREGIELLLIKDIRLFHQAFGYEYYIDQAGIYEIEIPNLFGGEPYPGIAETKAINVNRSRKTCTIIYDEYIDEEKATELLSETAEEISNSDTPLGSVDQFTDHSEFDAVLTSGWLTRALYTRTVVAGSEKGVEKMVLTLDQ